MGNRWLTSRELEYSAGNPTLFAGFTARNKVTCTALQQIKPKRPSLSVVNVYDKNDTQAPGLQTRPLPSRSKLRSNKALDRVNVRREAPAPTTSWVQSPKPDPERVDGSVKAGTVLRGYQGYPQGRSKFTSTPKSPRSGSRHRVKMLMSEQFNVPAEAPRRVVRLMASRRRERERHVPPLNPSRRSFEQQTFHNSKPLGHQQRIRRVPVHTTTLRQTKHQGTGAIVDEVIEEIVRDVAPTSKTLLPLGRTGGTGHLTVKIPLPEISATMVTSPSSAPRLRRFIGSENKAGGGGFVSTGQRSASQHRIDMDPRPVGCLLDVEGSAQDVPQETVESGFIGGRGFVGGRIGSARPGSPVKNGNFVGVRAKGERLVGGGFSASMLPSSPGYPRLCSSRTVREPSEHMKSLITSVSVEN